MENILTQLRGSRSRKSTSSLIEAISLSQSHQKRELFRSKVTFFSLVLVQTETMQDVEKSKL